MPYKISGTLSDAARIIIIKESNWAAETNSSESSGAYEIDSLDSGTKLIVARKSDGEIKSYSTVTPIYYANDTGCFAGGFSSVAEDNCNIIDYIAISTTGNATNFGDLTDQKINDHTSASNGPNDRGVFMAGTWSPGGLTRTNIIEYITISSPGNAQDFGDLLTERNERPGGTSNNSGNRAVIGAGRTSAEVYLNDIEYFNLASLGNASFFGNVTVGRYDLSACSNGTNNRALFIGGWQSPGTYSNIIDYITITSTGNASDFGDMYALGRWTNATSNLTNNRGVIAGGRRGPSPVYSNTIEYINISSLSNGVNFGDLSEGVYSPGAASNGTSNRGVFAGGQFGSYSYQHRNIIDYITITSTGNASDFGDLTEPRSGCWGVSNA